MMIEKWAERFAENHVQFSSPSEASGVSAGRVGEGSDRLDLVFSEVYHKLIHSPALDTLLQLEHTYAMAVADVCKGRENASEILQKRCVCVCVCKNIFIHLSHIHSCIYHQT